jgi:uncharacterized membrane protein YdjX (TVP38/TMEM64 family)
MPEADRRETRPRTDRIPLRRFLPLVGVVVLASLVLAMGWHRELSLENLVRYRTEIDALISNHWILALAVFVASYIAVVTLSLPGGAIMTVSGGILFGAFAGGLASIAGATIGATLLFLVARTAFGEHLTRRAGPWVARLAEGFREDAFHYLLFLRLVPAFPFFIVNLVAALMGVKLATFVSATLIGIIPATFAFAFAGAGLDSVVAAQETAYRACLQAHGSGCQLDFDIGAAITPQLIVALVLLGVAALIPVAVKRLRARRMANSSG